MWRTIILILAVAATIAPTNGCLKRRRSEESGDDDGYYCVCNATYCDEAPDVNRTSNSMEYVLITSSKSGLFFHVSNGVYENVKETDAPSLGKITINRADVYQEIFGFGGAVTDSAALNINNLTYETSEHLLRSYFGPRGINYSFIRTPIGSSDFSSRPYTYAMEEYDILLNCFNLVTEDYVYRIPTLKRAQELSKGKIKLLSTPWSASVWMKVTTQTSNSTTKLRPEYRQLWADYFVKFYEAYRSHGIEFWGTTCQNEPENYKYANCDILACDFPVLFSLLGMAYTPEEERDWIVEYLAPTLKKNKFGHIKIFSMDDNRLSLPHWPKMVFQDQKARDVISGTAIHFYYDNVVNSSVLDEIKQLFPEKSLIYSEASIGIFEVKKVILGSWERGERYAKNIIENMSHWVSAWIDWNIALNTIGGPTYIKNHVDSSIIVNGTADEFYKQPMFYVLGHFSKYVPPNSVRIGTTSENTEGIQNIAFSTSDGGIVLVILNLNEEEKEVLINDPKKGTARLNVPGKSINTMKYW